MHENVLYLPPVSLAAQGGHPGAIELLLDAGADINGGAREKLTLQQQVDRNAKPNVTPLMLAAYHGHLDAVK